MLRQTICTHTCTVQVLHMYSESLFFILDESGCGSGSGESESSENENGTSLTREGFSNCSRKRRRTDTNSTDEEARKNRKKQLLCVI